MKKWFIALAALLLFGGVALVPASASAEAHWKYYGADHAYASKDAAKADAARVFIRAGWPPKVAQAMQKKMQTMPPDKRIVLKKGDRLDFMRSGPKALWFDVTVDFVSMKGINITADADVYVVEEDGVTYEGILPDVCNNLAGRRLEAPKKKSPCGYVLVPAKENGGFLSVAAFGNITPEEEADCPITYQGPGTGANGREFNPNGYLPLKESAEHPCDWTAIEAKLGLPKYKSGCIKVSAGWYVVRVPLSFIERMDRRIVFCYTKQNGEVTYGLGVLPEEYHQAPSGNWIATVWYGEEEVPAEFRGNTILWWHWYSAGQLQTASP